MEEYVRKLVDNTFRDYSYMYLDNDYLEDE